MPDDQDPTRRSELSLLAGDAWRALSRPLAFARELGEPRHGLGVVLIAIAAGAALALGVDLLVLAGNARSALEVPAPIVTDMVLLGLRSAVVAAIAAAGAGLALRLLGRRTEGVHLYTATAWSLVWWLPLPAFVALALAAELPMLVPAAALALSACLVAALFLGLRGLARGARLVAAFLIALAVLGYGHLDRFGAAAVSTATLEPSLVAPLEAAPAPGEPRARQGHVVTLDGSWQLSLTAQPGELGRYASPDASLRVLRVRGAPLKTLTEVADDVLRPELLGNAGVRISERRLVSDAGRLMVEDLRAFVYEGVDIILGLYTTRGAEGPVVLLFRGNQRSDLHGAVPEWRSIASSLVLPGDPAP